MNQPFGPEFASLDEAYLAVMDLLIRCGAGSAPRGLPTLELLPFAFSISNPRRRYISLPERRWSIAYAIAEFAWHLRASDSTEEIAFYAPRWRKIARGSPAISGSSYGARVFRRLNGHPSQWDRVLDLLRHDPASRRAVLQFSPPDADPLDPEADIACALSLQFLARDGRLDAVCTMRSNDALLGLPYDVFLFTMMQELAATTLGFELGRYHHQAASLHLYSPQVGLAERIVVSRPAVVEPMSPMDTVEGLGMLLDGEAQSRLGLARRYEPIHGASYWSDLLEVVQVWTERRGGEAECGGPPRLRNSVLNSLLAQWFSG